MPETCELLRARETGRAGSDDGDALAAAARGALRRYPALAPGAVRNGRLDRFDRDRRVIDVERAGGFARGRTNTTGDLGEVVGLVQPIDRRPPILLVDEIVPVRDQVADRAARMAE